MVQNNLVWGVILTPKFHSKSRNEITTISKWNYFLFLNVIGLLNNLDTDVNSFITEFK